MIIKQSPGSVIVKDSSLLYILANIFIRHYTYINRQIVGIPMKTNCAPVVIDLLSFCCETRTVRGNTHIRTILSSASLRLRGLEHSRSLRTCRDKIKKDYRQSRDNSRENPNMKFSLHQRPPRYSRNISMKLCIDISKIKPKRSVISIFHQKVT